MSTDVITLQRVPRRTGYKRKRQTASMPRRTRTRTMAYKKPSYSRRKSVNSRTGGLLGIETKWIDYDRTSLALTSVWSTSRSDPATVDCLSVVAQGDGESQRDGKQYAIKSCFVSGYINVPASESEVAPVNDIVVRLALVLDTQTNGAALTGDQVFDSTANPDIDSFRNLQYTKRFRVLKDKKFVIPMSNKMVNEGAVNLFATSGTTKLFKMNHVFKTPLIVNTTGTTAVIANVMDNSIHVLAIAQNVAKAPVILYTSRCRFVG